jgi:hypothetical protein
MTAFRSGLSNVRSLVPKQAPKRRCTSVSSIGIRRQNVAKVGSGQNMFPPGIAGLCFCRHASGPGIAVITVGFNA